MFNIQMASHYPFYQLFEYLLMAYQLSNYLLTIHKKMLHLYSEQNVYTKCTV